MRKVPDSSDLKVARQGGEDVAGATAPSPARGLKWSADEVLAFIAREFPQASGYGSYVIERLEPERATVRLNVTKAHLRPGGSVSGPALMALMDYAVYVLLLAHHGANARLTVTTGLQMSFLRKAGLEDVACDVELIKHGRTLTVADGRIRACADGRLVAHSEATYFMGEARRV
jgi:uncharacterized protein (TIGR00369 family)